MRHGDVPALQINKGGCDTKRGIDAHVSLFLWYNNLDYALT